MGPLLGVIGSAVSQPTAPGSTNIWDAVLGVTLATGLLFLFLWIIMS